MAAETQTLDRIFSEVRHLSPEYRLRLVQRIIQTLVSSSPLQVPQPKVLTLHNGRTVSYTEYGDASGSPIICFHGMPGSRILFKLMDEAARNAGVRLIAPERPGYSLSQPSAKATLLHYSDDIAELADKWELTQFAVMGMSGGGPYALACAYKLVHRLTVAAIVSGIGPLRLPGSTADMVRGNRMIFRLGKLSPRLVALLLPQLMKLSLRSMATHIQQGTSPTPDMSPEHFAIMVTDQREAIRIGGNGIKFDMTAMWQPWGFELEDIRTKVYLWHGEADNLAPAALAHHIADHVPNCEATFYPDEGHIEPLMKHMDEIMAKVVDTSQPM
jgi:pimeloyl-ACP methyl ester carboxylesterase